MQPQKSWVLAAFARSTRIDLSLLRLEFLHYHGISTQGIEKALAELETLQRTCRAVIEQELDDGMTVAASRAVQQCQYGDIPMPAISQSPSEVAMEDLVFLESAAGLQRSCQDYHVWLQVYQVRQKQYQILKLTVEAYKELHGAEDDPAVLEAERILGNIIAERQNLAENLHQLAYRILHGMNRAKKEMGGRERLAAIELKNRLKVEMAERDEGELPYGWDGLGRKIRQRVAGAAATLKILQRETLPRPAWAAAASAALLCLTLGYGISREEHSSRPLPGNNAAELTPRKSSKTLNEFIESLRRKAAGATQRKTGPLVARARALAVAFEPAPEPVLAKASPVPSETIAVETAESPAASPPMKIEAIADPGQRMEAFLKMVKADRVPIAEQYRIYHTAIEPLMDTFLSDAAQPPELRAKAQALRAVFVEIRLPEKGEGAVQGDLNGALGATARRKVDGHVGPVPDISFGKIVDVHGVDATHLVAGFDDVIGDGGVSDSGKAPPDPVIKTLDRSRYAELAINVSTAREVKLLKTTETGVDLDSIHIEDAEGNPVKVESYRVWVDDYQDVHVGYFRGAPPQVVVRYRISPIATTEGGDLAALVTHYTKISPARLDLPPEVRSEFESWKGLPVGKIAQKLAAYIREHTVYSVAPEVDRRYAKGQPIAPVLLSTKGQVAYCHIDAVAFDEIMRGFFDKAARYVRVYLSVGTPGSQILLRGAHASDEYLDPATARWIGIDATGAPPFQPGTEAVDLARLKANPINYEYLFERVASRRSDGGDSARATEERRTLLRIAREMGDPARLRSAIDLALQQALAGLVFGSPRDASRVWRTAAFFWPVPRTRERPTFDELVSPDRETDALVHNRVRERILSDEMNSHERAAYMIAFNVYDNVDEFYNLGRLETRGYISVRIAQYYATGRTLDDLVLREEIRHCIAQDDNLSDLIIIPQRRNVGRRIFDFEAVPEVHLDFIFTVLEEEGRVDAAFENLISGGGAFRSLPFLAYLANRTQDPEQIERVRALYQSLTTLRDREDFFTRHNAPWLLLLDSSSDAMAWISDPPDVGAFMRYANLIACFTRLDAGLLRQVFSPVASRITADLRDHEGRVFLEAISRRECLPLLNLLLFLAQYEHDPTLIEYARMVAELVANTALPRSFSDLNLGVLRDLLYLEGEKGILILLALLNRDEPLAEPYLERLLSVYLEALSERPADFVEAPRFSQAIYHFDMGLLNRALAAGKMEQAAALAGHLAGVVEGNSIGNLLDIDAGNLGKLLYVSNDGSGIKIVLRLAERSGFGTLEEAADFLQQYQAAIQERPSDFRPSRAALQNSLQLANMLLPWQIRVLRAQGQGTERIARDYQAALYCIPPRLIVRRYPGAGPLLFSALLSDRLIAEGLGVPGLAVESFMDAIFERHGSQAPRIRRVLQRELLSPAFPPAAQALGLRYYHMTFDAEPISREGYQQMAEVAAAYSDRAMALHLMLAGSMQGGVEDRDSFAVLVPEFVAQADSFPPQTRVVIASFLLAETTSLEEMQQLIDIIRANPATISPVNLEIIERDLERYIQSIMPRSVDLGRGGRLLVSGEAIMQPAQITALLLEVRAIYALLGISDRMPSALRGSSYVQGQ